MVYICLDCMEKTEVVRLRPFFLNQSCGGEARDHIGFNVFIAFYPCFESAKPTRVMVSASAMQFDL